MRGTLEAVLFCLCVGQTFCAQENQRCPDLSHVSSSLGDGPYTRCQLAEELYNQNFTPFEVGLFFTELDTNGDNNLTLAEINDAITNQRVCEAFYSALSEEVLVNSHSIELVRSFHPIDSPLVG